MRNRAASEIIGFILVFSLVVASVGLVYIFGFTGLESARDTEQMENVERAFDVLADNVDDLHQENAPNRATELKLYNAQVELGEATRMTVTINNIGSGPSFSLTTRPVVYRAQNSPTEIRYVAGAVFREDRRGELVLDQPEFLFRIDDGKRTAVIPLIELRSRGSRSVGGSTTVLVRKDRVLKEVLNASTDPSADGVTTYDVSFTIDTTERRAPLWKEEVEADIDEAYGDSDYCTVSGETVTCDFEVDRLYVTATRIDVAIEQ